MPTRGSRGAWILAVPLAVALSGCDSSDNNCDAGAMCSPPEPDGMDAGPDAGPDTGCAVQDIGTSDVWAGISESTIGGPTGTEIDAGVVWHPDGKIHPRCVLGYTAAGTISISSLAACPLVYTDPTAFFGGGGGGVGAAGYGSGQLLIDTSVNPPTWNANAVTQWLTMVSSSCGGSGAQTLAGGDWLSAQGTLAPDHNSFSGVYTNSTLLQTFTFNFQRVKKP